MELVSCLESLDALFAGLEPIQVDPTFEDLLHPRNVVRDVEALAGQRQENPVAEGHDDSAWRLNRRVEIRYDR